MNGLNMMMIKNRYDVGNAQLQGVKKQQNDYFAICNNDDKLLIALADGRSDYIEGKYSAVFAVETLKQNFKNIRGYANNNEYFKNSFGDINYGIGKREFSHKTSTSVACALFYKKNILWASVGDSKIFLYRKGNLIALNDVAMGEQKLKRRDILLFCSNGVLECIAEYEIIHLLSVKQNTYEKAQTFVDYIKKQGYIHQANATVIIMEVAVGGK